MADVGLVGAVDDEAETVVHRPRCSVLRGDVQQCLRDADTGEMVETGEGQLGSQTESLIVRVDTDLRRSHRGRRRDAWSSRTPRTDHRGRSTRRSTALTTMAGASAGAAFRSSIRLVRDVRRRPGCTVDHALVAGAEPSRRHLGLRRSAVSVHQRRWRSARSRGHRRDGVVGGGRLSHRIRPPTTRGGDREELDGLSRRRCRHGDDRSRLASSSRRRVVWRWPLQDGAGVTALPATVALAT